MSNCYFADKAKVIFAPQAVYLPYGRPAVLDCHFRSNPPLTNLRWEKDGFLYDPYNVQVNIIDTMHVSYDEMGFQVFSGLFWGQFRFTPGQFRVTFPIRFSTIPFSSSQLFFPTLPAFNLGRIL